MKLENLVSSLPLSQEYARLMKEKGRELPESVFWWEWYITTEIRKTTDIPPKLVYLPNKPSTRGKPLLNAQHIPALTSGEIGELLYQAFEETDWDLLYKAYGEVFDFKGTQRIGDLGIINLMRKPDMGLKMLNYLLANDLIRTK